MTAGHAAARIGERRRSGDCGRIVRACDPRGHVYDACDREFLKTVVFPGEDEMARVHWQGGHAARTVVRTACSLGGAG